MTTMTLLRACRILLSMSLLWHLVFSNAVGDDEEHSLSDFLYAQPDENKPVIEFFPAVSGLPKRGDFRTSVKAKMVEFYNPYCGACQSYKPTYLKLARALEKQVGDDMEIYSVSCQVHKVLCDEYDVDEIPLVGLFRAGIPNPQLLRKLKVPEKVPRFILSYLFPGTDAESESRALLDEGDENGDNNGSDEEDAGNDNNEGEEEDEDEAEEEEDAKNSEDNEAEGGGENSGDEEEDDAEEDQANEINAGEDGENNDEEGSENNDNEENESEEAENEEDSETNDVGEAAEGEEEDIHNQSEGEDGNEEGDDEEKDEESEVEASNEEGDNEGNDEQGQEEEETDGQPAFGEGARIGEEDEERDIEAVAADAEEANREWFKSVASDKLNLRMGSGSGALPRLEPSAKMRQYAKPVAGAGAMMKDNVVSDMDRFQEAMLKRQEKKLISVFRRGPLGAPGQKMKQENIDSETGATRAMKAHTPGTPEYQARQQKVQSHLDNVLKQKRLRTTAPAQKTFSAGAGGVSRFELPANHKPVLPYKKEVQKPKLVHDIAGKVPIVRRIVKLSHEEELILDASLSFITALESGLFSNPDPLSKSKKKAFQTWLDLLRISLPPEWGLHELIMDLDNNLDFVTQKDDNLQRFLKRHELPRKEWSRSCTKMGRAKKNGFNCGFWRLLHVATIGVAEHQGGLNLIEANLISKEARVFSPHEAADAIKDFIANFFPCTPCKNHFVAAYDECSNRRCVRLTDSTGDASFADWQELSKWLWEFHNDVNVRLFKERNKDKELSIHDEISVLYPTLEACASCFRDDGGYDEDGVFLYLEKEYWPGASDIDPAADKLLKFHNVEYAGFASSWAILFVGVGLIYMLRPRGVHKGRKKRSD